METASHAWWFLRAPLDGIHVQGFRETPRDTFTFFLTGFRQRTENVTFASYNKGGSVKAVKKKDLLETVQLCSRIHRMCITLRYYSSALF